MPVRITILAENIKAGTEVLEYAISAGCAVERYENDVESPLAKPKKKYKKRKATEIVAKKKPVKAGGVSKYKLQPGVANFRPGSRRERGFFAVRGTKKALRRVEWIAELLGNGFTDAQSKSLVAGFLKAGVLAAV